MVQSIKIGFTKSLGIWLLVLGFLGLTAFVIPDSGTSPIFHENFEEYFSTVQVKRAFTIWQDGASLDISLDTKQIEGGKQSLRIDVLGPNPFDGVKNGSIYHALPMGSRNWLNASEISFWVSNPSDNALWLTFNFKEAYNEYWSVKHGGAFLLQSSAGSSIQYESQYGNLVIPAQFTGKVILPVNNFSIPEWNTARGDKQLQLANIESFAIGITLNEDYPRTFYIDSLNILPPGETPATIHGVKQIRIPESGEYRVAYKIENGLSEDSIQGNWKVKSQTNPMVSIDQDGVLTIPAGTRDETISIISGRPSSDGSSEVSMDVILFSDSSGTAIAQTSGKEETLAEEKMQGSDYDRFAANFELWAMENRPLFVLLSVGLVVFIIFLLSVFQNRLK